ncbi:unnamed protein product [Mycena citricolor]|uniref:Uncharacterized protein n=1 Tax=Mycena citricolor TaxID=2018698 RepID=A0AAD2HP59_9AGAR|nr:unnamed protein product [Mycena citricolor]
MSGSTILRRLFPLVVFPVLSALALKLTFGNIRASGLRPQLEAQCPIPLGSAPHRLEYTTLESVDKALCGIVTFFHLALTPEVLPLLNYFLGSAFSLLALPAFESHRIGRASILGLPVLVGLSMQVFTVGAVLPLYWLVFIFSGAAERKPPNASVPNAHAQATVFGLVVGVGVPSACLILLRDSHVTALWQIFPVFQFIAQAAHLLVRRSDTRSGFSWVQALYLGAFIIASSTHLATLFGLGPDVVDLKALFTPSVAPRLDVPMNLKAFDFLQWDLFFAFGSTLLATLWFARSASQFILLVLWNTAGSILFGPGAAIAGVALWRESYLHSGPKSQEKKKE